ncbi:hypothetical protein [Spongiactinospora sp. TRM90649]|uniref:hypothetical protein n=1 Tax=Spongiactinospora sp. TRM90649 TaxID=3031114 RepID=UPI0023F9F6BB|nr:hypothetical protein [Spongiactinospora sp. TRM90649]MDF5755621.1 hypothetical protein [Spongiactinospora sp. TRM90649]
MNDKLSADDAKLSADDALRRIDEVGGTVRRSGKWAGRWVLTMGLAAIPYWLVMLLGDDTVKDIAGWAWIVFVALSFGYVFRQRVYSRSAWRLQWPIAFGFVGTCTVAVLFSIFLMPDDPDALWTALAVLVSLVAGAPPIYGGWRLLREEDVDD